MVFTAISVLAIWDNWLAMSSELAYSSLMTCCLRLPVTSVSLSSPSINSLTMVWFDSLALTTTVCVACSATATTTSRAAVVRWRPPPVVRERAHWLMMFTTALGSANRIG